MTNVIQTTTTETHQYVIQAGWRHPDMFQVQYRPLNPKTGQPWQAPRRLDGDVSLGAKDGTDLNRNYMIYFSTIELARAAIEKQIAVFQKRKRAR